MGEVMDAGSSFTGAFGLSGLSAVLSFLALGIYALLQRDTGNDDDDSSPGGGLMQPVA